jgi:hypothetical protein
MIGARISRLTIDPHLERIRALWLIPLALGQLSR